MSDKDAQPAHSFFHCRIQPMNWSNGKQQNDTSVVPRNMNKAIAENSSPSKFCGSVHDKTFFFYQWNNFGNLTIVQVWQQFTNNKQSGHNEKKYIKKDFEKHTFINETIWRTQDFPGQVTVY